MMLAHVYLYSRGIPIDNLLTFWLPLELAGFLILISIMYTDQVWVFALVMIFAAALHLVLAASTVPEFVNGTDELYGYQLVNLTLNTGHWTFGAGTGESLIYSYFPFMFIFTSLWSGIGSIPPFLLVNYGFAFINLASFLSLRMLCVDLLNFSRRQVNLVLFLYSLTPLIHRVEAVFHYEAYAVIFFSLVLLYLLKPNISAPERIVTVISIIAIVLSHYFTAYFLLLNSLVVGVAYLVLRGTRVNVSLLFMSIVAPLAVISNVAVGNFTSQIFRVENVLAHFKDLSSLFSQLTAFSSEAVATYYPAPWFAELAFARNIMELVLGLLAIFTLCISVSRRLRIHFRKRDALTYLAATWLFSLLFSLALYYGVAWDETVLASNGPGEAGNRIAEFGFMQFALFAGLGFSILLNSIENHLRGKRLRFLKPGMKGILAIFLIIIFASSVVAQAYPRIVYDSGYTPLYFDEYKPTFQEPYYLGSWWYSAANHTTASSRPWTGSRVLFDFVSGYGWQPWTDTLNQSSVDINSPRSQYFTVYYGLDVLQVNKPDHLSKQTLDPLYVSSAYTRLDTIFDNGRLMVDCKPIGT
jgi:hypothetical protein